MDTCASALCFAATEIVAAETRQYVRFNHWPKVLDSQPRVRACMDEQVYPNERRFPCEIEASTKRGARRKPTRLAEEQKARAQWSKPAWLGATRRGSRRRFGALAARQTVWQKRIAGSRCRIDRARAVKWMAAQMMDMVGNNAACAAIAMMKIIAPNAACTAPDWAIQAHGGGGTSVDFPFAHADTPAPTLRRADGPDEVHHNALAKHVLLSPGEGAKR